MRRDRPLPSPGCAWLPPGLRVVGTLFLALSAAAAPSNPSSAATAAPLAAPAAPPSPVPPGPALASLDAPLATIGGYSKISYSQLAGFKFRPPPQPIATDRPPPEVLAQVPAAIRRLDGKKVVLTGYMLPLTLKDGLATEFFFLSSPIYHAMTPCRPPYGGSGRRVIGTAVMLAEMEYSLVPG